jgi:hypothetical protein
VRYQADSVDIVLSPKRKNRWFCVAHCLAGDGAPVRTLANATVLDPGDGKQRDAFLHALPPDLPEGAAADLRQLLLYAAEHVAADTRGWQGWQEEQAARRVAEVLAKAEAERVAQRAAHLGGLEAEALARLRDPKLLFTLGQDLDTWGLVGERANALTLELAVVSRVTDEPISSVVKGESAGGKSYQVKAVLAFHPEDAHIDLTSMSEKGLIYDPRDYAHRVLCFYEVDGEAANPFAAYLLRTLISEGQLNHLTVDTSGGVPAGTLITKEGPIGFVSTTTEPALEAQQETRTLSLLADDSEAQTKRVLARQALEARGGLAAADPGPWQCMHEWLAAAGLARVRIPFAGRLPSRMPVRRTRVRRDFRRLLYLIKASALLHQYQRQRTPAGEVVATLSDYAMVREVATVAMGRSMLGINEKTLELVATTIGLHAEKKAKAQSGEAVFVTYRDLVKETKLPRLTVWRWLQPALELGAQDNPNEGQRGRQAQLSPGAYVVDTAMVLPEVDQVAYTGETVTWISPMDGTERTVGGAGARPAAEPDGSDEVVHLFTGEGEGNYFSPESAPDAEKAPPPAKIFCSPLCREQVNNHPDEGEGTASARSKAAETSGIRAEQADEQV